jgi:hypothetical protein
MKGIGMEEDETDEWPVSMSVTGMGALVASSSTITGNLTVGPAPEPPDDVLEQVERLWDFYEYFSDWATYHSSDIDAVRQWIEELIKGLARAQDEVQACA